MDALHQPKDPGWAECFLNLADLHAGQIHVDEPKRQSGPGVFSYYGLQRPLAAISYSHDLLKMPVLSFITPFMKVLSWDSTTGRLDLETSVTISGKLGAIQEIILGQLALHPEWLRAYGLSKEELRSSFQHLFHGTLVSLYLHGPNTDIKPAGRVWLWDHGWQRGVTQDSFKTGQRVRVAVRLQGVCFLQGEQGRTRLRLQHQTVAVYHKECPAPEVA